MICLALLLASGCAPAELSPQAYLQWANDPGSGLVYKKQLGDLVFKLQHLPPELMALRSHGSQAPESPEWPSWVDQYRKATYFSFRIEMTDGQGTVLKRQIGSQEAYDARLRHFAFDMQREIHLVQGRDTFDCVLFHFERSYQLAPFSIFMLAFEKENADSETLFVYEDSQLGTGPVRFLLSSQASLHLPKIALK